MKTFLLISFLFLSHQSSAFRIELSKSELANLRKGETIERVEEVKDQPFPKVTLIKVIPYSPPENMKVFTDFESHKTFIPDLIKSKVVSKAGNKTDVEFEMDLPAPAGNTQYITRHILQIEKGAQILRWTLLKSKQLKATSGSITFESFDEKKSLFTYVSQITPSSSLAWVVKGKVVPDTRKAFEAITKHLDKKK